jgi:hypothetical protein
MQIQLSEHAGERLQQRGLRERDVDVVLRHGTPMGDAVVLTAKDVDAVIRERKRQIADLERLRGMAVFVRQSVVVTLFRPTPQQLRRLARGLRFVRRRRRVNARPAS